MTKCEILAVFPILSKQLEITKAVFQPRLFHFSGEEEEDEEEEGEISLPKIHLQVNTCYLLA